MVYPNRSQPRVFPLHQLLAPPWLPLFATVPALSPEPSRPRRSLSWNLAVVSHGSEESDGIRITLSIVWDTPW